MGSIEGYVCEGASPEKSSRLKILIVSNLLPPQVLGGYEIACYDIARGLRELGHDVRILTTPTAHKVTDDQSWVRRHLGLRTYAPLPDTTYSVARFLQHESGVSRFENSRILLEELRDFRPDQTILFNLVGIGGIALIDVLQRVGAAWTFNLGDQVPVQLKAAGSAEILSIFGADAPDFFSAGNIIALSHGLVNEIESAGVQLGDDVAYIPRGVQVPQQPRTRPYQDAGVTRFMMASSLGAHKGIDAVIEAATQLQDLGERFVVDIYGGGDVAHYEALAASSGVGDRIHFHGFADRATLVEAHLSSDVFLFPTEQREPFGIAPVEAAAAGCVPFITVGSGVSEWFVSGEQCLKIQRDPESVAAAMRSAIEGEIDLPAMGKAARILCESTLSFESCLRALEKNIAANSASEDWLDRLYESSVEESLLERDIEATNRLHASFIQPVEGSTQ